MKILSIPHWQIGCIALALLTLGAAAPAHADTAGYLQQATYGYAKRDYYYHNGKKYYRKSYKNRGYKKGYKRFNHGYDRGYHNRSYRGYNKRYSKKRRYSRRYRQC